MHGAVDPEIMFEQMQGWLKQPAKPLPSYTGAQLTKRASLQ